MVSLFIAWQMVMSKSLVSLIPDIYSKTVTRLFLRCEPDENPLNCATLLNDRFLCRKKTSNSLRSKSGPGKLLQKMVRQSGFFRAKMRDFLVHKVAF